MFKEDGTVLHFQHPRGEFFLPIQRRCQRFRAARRRLASVSTEAGGTSGHMTT